MVASIAAMVVWIIVAHHLWERLGEREASVALGGALQRREQLTITVAVPISYAVLFALIFLAAWVFATSSYLQLTLKHPVGLDNYLTLTCITASLATVAGALGSSLEDEDTVGEAAYDHPQRRRQQDEDGSEDGSAK